MDRFAAESQAVVWFSACGETAPRCVRIATEQITQPQSNFAYWCKACRCTFTVRTGTVMEPSKLPLQKWAMDIYYVLTARKGIGSLQLSKELSITQKSAWFLLQRICETCQQGGCKLSLGVEADEVYLGGREYNRHTSQRRHLGRGTAGKQAVLGLCQRYGLVRVRAMPIDKTDRPTLQRLIGQHVEP